jgi:hypothetical protein
VISSAEPPEIPTQPGLTTARIRVVVADLEAIAPDLAGEGEVDLAEWAHRLAWKLRSLLTAADERTRPFAATPPTPSKPPPNTGV